MRGEGRKGYGMLGDFGPQNMFAIKKKHLSAAVFPQRSFEHFLDTSIELNSVHLNMGRWKVLQGTLKCVLWTN